MPVEPENAPHQFMAEAVHHRHDDDQGGDPQKNAQQRKQGDDGNEPLLPARPQITEGDHPFETAEHQTRSHPRPATTASASSALSSRRSPVRRDFTSTLPNFAPLGPTMICRGRPIRSISANFTPA